MLRVKTTSTTDYCNDGHRTVLNVKAVNLPKNLIPTLAYSHKLWVLTERMRLQI